MNRKEIAAAVILAALVAACATNEQYRTSTGFYTLKRGISMEEFFKGYPVSEVIGSAPAGQHHLERDGARWDVLIYDVYNGGMVKRGETRPDHQEHVVFKNGVLEDWGMGSVPFILKDSAK